MLKKSYPVLIAVFIFSLLYFFSTRIPQENIRLFLDRVGLWGPTIFILLMLTTNVIAPLSGTPLMFAGFYAFGSNVVFLTMFADFISSITNFWIARRWGRSFVKKFVGRGNVEKIDKLTQHHGLAALLLLRIFQGGIGDFISYAAGLTSIQFTPYLIISVAGMIPRTALWYLLSLHTTSPLIFTILTLLLILVLSGLFVTILAFNKRWKR